MASDSKTPRLRWIPINEIPLHDRPGPDALRSAAEAFKATGHCPDVRKWLERVANIPEDPK